MDETRKARAWDQAPGEDPDAFELFSRYLAHPTSIVRDFADSYGLNPGTVGALAARYRWRARRAALIAHLHECRIVEAENDARDLGAEIARHLGVAVDLAGESLRTALAAGDLPSVRDSIAILAEAHKQVQLGAGRPTTIVDVSGATDSDLEAAEAALAKLNRTKQAPEPAEAEDPGEDPPLH